MDYLKAANSLNENQSSFPYAAWLKRRINKLSIIDTGADIGNPYFVQKGVHFIGDTDDFSWHGTSVLGMIAMNLSTDDTVSVRNAVKQRRVSSERVIEIVKRDLLEDNKLIAIALNGLIDTSTLSGDRIVEGWKSVVEIAQEKDALIFTSAGNNSLDLNKLGRFKLLPAMTSGVVTIGSGCGQAREAYSNRGDYVDMLVRGGSIDYPLVTTRNRFYSNFLPDEMVNGLPSDYIRVFGTSLSMGLAVGEIVKESKELEE